MDNPGKRATGQLGEYATTPNSPPERSTGEIMGDIMANAQEIIRSEIRLARVEIKEEGRKAIRAVTMFGAGAVMAMFALGFVLWAIAYALGLALAMWAATLILGVVLAIGAAIGIAVGRRRWAEIHKPERTVEELKENAQWLKHPTKY
jgi:uncharacterized membrane protein YqjE